LKFLEEQGVRGLTISAEDIVDGENINQLLGFCWMLLRRFQVTPDFDDNEGGGGGNTFETRMLEWCKNVLSEYSDINITGWDSFKDGKPLLALLEKYDKKILNYNGFDKNDPLNNARSALQLAEQFINIPQDLIEAQELVEGQVSEKQMVLYLTLFYNAFSDKDNLMSRESILSKIRELENELNNSTADRDHMLGVTGELEDRKVTLTQELETVSFERDDLAAWKKRMEEEWRLEKEHLAKRIKELEERIAVLKTSTDSTTSDLQLENEKLRKERDELLKATKKLEKEIEELEKQFTRFSKKLAKEQRVRKELESFLDKQKQNWDLGVSAIRQNLLQHISDMNVWKVFLEQNSDYQVEDSVLFKDETVSANPHPEQIRLLDQALQEEVSRFGVLLDDKTKASTAVEALEEESNTKVRVSKSSRKKKKKKAKKE